MVTKKGRTEKSLNKEIDFSNSHPKIMLIRVPLNVYVRRQTKNEPVPTNRSAFLIIAIRSLLIFQILCLTKERYQC